MPPPLLRRALRPCLAAALAAIAALAQAQSGCSSDGQPQPTALYERFISADCEACWTQPGPASTPGPSALLIDWIVPGAQGDDAPLSAAATRDALERLQSIARPLPAPTDTHVDDVPPLPAPALLRVAQGPPLADYLGTSLRFIPPRAPAADSYQVTVLMLETVPAGTEGSPMARNIVRNAFKGILDKRQQLPKKERGGWLEIRPMRIPDGARPERLRVAAWVQDPAGRIVAAALSQCGPGD